SPSGATKVGSTAPDSTGSSSASTSTNSGRSSALACSSVANSGALLATSCDAVPTTAADADSAAAGKMAEFACWTGPARLILTAVFTADSPPKHKHFGHLRVVRDCPTASAGADIRPGSAGSPGRASAEHPGTQPAVRRWARHPACAGSAGCRAAIDQFRG